MSKNKGRINLGRNANIDLQKLIATRMLINANSGGGKSWAIRRLLEQSHGQVQQIIIDLEGEFDFSIKAIIPKLGKCEREIYEVLLEHPHEEFTLEVVAGMTPSQYPYTSGGFNNSISKLSTYGIIERGKGTVKLNQNC